MSNIKGTKDAKTNCIEGVLCYSEECAKHGCVSAKKAKEAGCQHDVAHGHDCKKCGAIAAANVLWSRIMQKIESMPDYQQTHVIECGMRLRELACFYGPYFTLALSLTSAEIASERLIMQKTAPCDNAPTDLMLQGGKSAADVQNPEIILPHGTSKH